MRAAPTRPRLSAKLARGLDDLALRYAKAPDLALDPLRIVLDYPDRADRELAAWVASTLAYGKVAPMLKAIQAGLRPFGPQPAAFVRDASGPQLRRIASRGLSGWAWRFHTAEDLTEWILAWKRLDAEGGLETHFLPAEDGSVDGALSRLVQRLRRQMPATYGLRFSLPDPAEGGACKRWRLFLRWMVRKGWPDLGLWTRYPAAQLVIPLDTHVARISKFIGLSTRTTPDGAMAREITQALRTVDPEDPVRFDFALSHLGIQGDCPGKRQLPHCAPCPLRRWCKA